MTGTTPETPHFGLTRVASGEAVSKNGYSALNLDPLKIDKILYALATHSHNGDPALGNPTDPAGLVASTTGGQIPAGSTFYYRVAFVDEHGLETAASPEASVTTQPVIVSPAAPVLTVNTAGGSIGVGSYRYAITFVDATGGQTTASPGTSVQVTSGTANRVKVEMPALPSGATGYAIYRTRPGQTQLYKIAQTSSSTYYDTGSGEDTSIIAPTTNSTNSRNSITVTIPLNFIPLGCASWKIYRAQTSGGYTGNSLVHWVVEGETSTSPIPRRTWVDNGAALTAGFPQNISSTMPQGKVLNLAEVSGQVPLTALPRGAQQLSIFGAGVLTNGQTLHVTNSPGIVEPVRFTAFFKTPNTTATSVTFRVTDSASNYVELLCSAGSHGSGDATGYWHKEWPLLKSASFEAETGTRSSSSVPIDNDVAAYNGQAVTLAHVNEYIEVDLGVLDPGTYYTSIRLRVLAFDGAHPGNDLLLTAIRTDTNATIGSTSFSITAGSTPLPADYMYRNVTALGFTAPGGTSVKVRITKAMSTSTQSYDVDQVNYTSNVPTLVPGKLTTSVIVAGGSTDAADVNVNLWF